MDINCENTRCVKTVDMHDDATYCHTCQKYYCDRCYELYHEYHDIDSRQDPSWVLAMQR